MSFFSTDSMHPHEIELLSHGVKQINKVKFWVPSRSQGSHVGHQVLLYPDGTDQCDCAGYFSRAYCRHTAAVKIYLERRARIAGQFEYEQSQEPEPEPEAKPQPKLKLEDLFTI